MIPQDDPMKKLLENAVKANNSYLSKKAEENQNPIQFKFGKVDTIVLYTN